MHTSRPRQLLHVRPRDPAATLRLALPVERLPTDRDLRGRVLGLLPHPRGHHLRQDRPPRHPRPRTHQQVQLRDVSAVWLRAGSEFESATAFPIWERILERGNRQCWVRCVQIQFSGMGFEILREEGLTVINFAASAFASLL